MKISEYMIKHKNVVGYTHQQQPIICIETYGGLFAFFTKNEKGGIETLATAAHRAVGAWMAEKRSPGLTWHEGFLKSESNLPRQYEILRKALFTPAVSCELSKSEAALSSTVEDLFIVYDPVTQVIGLMDERTVLDGIVDDSLHKGCIIRQLNLREPASSLEFHRLHKTSHEYQFHDRQHLEDYLKRGKFSILSAWRHDRPQHLNEQKHKELQEDLKAHGFLFTPVVGNWGGHHEPSFIVHRPGFMVHKPDKAVMHQLAQKYNQASHIYSHRGSHKELASRPDYKPPAGGRGHEVGEFADNFTVVPHPGGGGTKFRLKLGYGEPVSKSESGIRLIHFSDQSGLDNIDPKFMGTGVRSEETKQGVPAVKRSYYYRYGSAPEQLVQGGAKRMYVTQLEPTEKLYDLGTDPDKIATKLIQAHKGTMNTDMILQQVKDAGYHGFYNSTSQLPNAVALFYPKKVLAEDEI